MTFRELWLRFTFPVQQRRIERELREEIDLHVALRAEQLLRSGAAASDAAHLARKRFGNRSRIADAARDAWGWLWIDGARQDLRYILRQLRRSPGFVLVVSCTIALGVAINAAAFTFYDAVVLKPLAVSDPARAIRVLQDTRAFGRELLPFTAYDVLRRHASTMRDVVATTGPESFSAVLPGRALEDARVVNARFVSADFAPRLGVRTHLGRWFDEGDDRAVVLDHGFWTRVLDADPSVIGRRMRIGDVDLTIIGVAPEGFAGTGMPALAPDLWAPMSALPALVPNAAWETDGRPHWQVLARLAPGASLASASAELDVLRASVPDSAGKPISLVAKHATFFQTDAGEFEAFQQVSAALMVALALILGIAVVNLVNLFAARNAAREREVAVRLALGARRARIARQLASESVVLAFAGGVLGLLGSRMIVWWFRNWLLATAASISGGLGGVFLDVGVDWRVALYAGLLSLLIGLAVGVWPALRASRSDANLVLREGGTSTSGAAAWSKRNLLLATQVGGSLVLLTAAGMLLGGLRASWHIDPGFDADHVLVVILDDDAPMITRAARREEITHRLAALPAVQAVAWTRRVPFAGTYLRTGQYAGAPLTVSVDEVNGDYFGALGIGVERGRTFTREEVSRSAPVMIVSESMARLRWPGGNAIGQSVSPHELFAGPDTIRSYTVVGVVRDVRSQFLSRPNGPSIYFPYRFDTPYGGFLLRTRGAPATVANDVRVAIGGVSPFLIGRTHVITLQSGPMALQRLMAAAPASVALALALSGLLLASIGMYGVIAHIVSRRAREIGVHMALGARPLQVIRLVLVKTLRPVASGAVVGSAGAVALSFLLHSLISTPDMPDLTFGAGAFNPIVFVAVLGAFAVVVVLACFVPARRAATLDPTIALRSD